MKTLLRHFSYLAIRLSLIGALVQLPMCSPHCPPPAPPVPMPTPMK
jgi:hypothetical protein